MFRSVIFGFAVAVVCWLQTGCCCCCGDFVKGFQKGFDQGLKRGQPRQQDPGPPPVVQVDDAKRRADLKQLVANNIGPNTYAGTLAPGNAFWTKLKQTIDQKKVTHPMIVGDGQGPPISDTHPNGGVLIGLFVGEDENAQVVAFLQPIYLTSQGEKVGQEYGQPRKPVQVLKAKPGYAVGGATVRKGAIIDAIKVTFMKVDGGKLNPADSYESIQVGGQGGGEDTFLSKGPFLVGIHGKQNENDGFSPKGAPNSLGFYSLP